jgi:hypothetical protein
MVTFIGGDRDAIDRKIGTPSPLKNFPPTKSLHMKIFFLRNLKSSFLRRILKVFIIH